MKTWCNFLLYNQQKYIIANPEKVRQWLMYLFANHEDYIRLSRNHHLEFSQAAVEALRSQSELAEVLYDSDNATEDDVREHAIVQTELESGLSKAESFCFDKFPHLYLRSQQILNIKKKGLIAIFIILLSALMSFYKSICKAFFSDGAA